MYPMEEVPEHEYGMSLAGDLHTGWLLPRRMQQHPVVVGLGYLQGDLGGGNVDYIVISPTYSKTYTQLAPVSLAYW